MSTINSAPGVMEVRALDDAELDAVGGGVIPVAIVVVGSALVGAAVGTAVAIGICKAVSAILD